MLKEKETEPTDVGVIVGRFQVEELHQGHKDLIDTVLSKHDSVIIFLGLSPLKTTKNNPLDFISRKMMIIQAYPDVDVQYIKDVVSNEIWSKQLDERISDVIGPNLTTTLYGSRDAFCRYYSGVHPVIELEQRVFHNGTAQRKKIGVKSKSTKEFREGVIFATQNQFVNAVATVDVAIFNDDYTQVLLGRKPHREQYCFIGGFTDGQTSFEADARREVMEETHLEVSPMEYVGSFVIPDWRYRAEEQNIVTTFFMCKEIYGRPQADDDIEELRYFAIEDLKETDMVESHRPLLNALITKLTNKKPLPTAIDMMD